MKNLKLKIPPVVQAFLCVLTMWLLGRHFPLYSFEFGFRSAITAFTTTLGGLIAVAGIYAFRKAGTTVDPREPDKASKLVIIGIYNYTRNPMYLGLLLVLIGIAILFGTISSILVIPIFIRFMNCLQIEPEEEALAELFGESFREYRLKVRRWL